MEVTHHRCPDQFQSYVVNAAWRDPEAEAHAARTFSLWAQDEYQPPVTTSVPDALGRMNHNHESAFGKLKEAQDNINRSFAFKNPIKRVDPQAAEGYPRPGGGPGTEL